MIFDCIQNNFIHDSRVNEAKDVMRENIHKVNVDVCYNLITSKNIALSINYKCFNSVPSSIFHSIPLITYAFL